MQRRPVETRVAVLCNFRDSPPNFTEETRVSVSVWMARALPAMSLASAVKRSRSLVFSKGLPDRDMIEAL